MYRALWSTALVFALYSPAFAQTVNIDNPADGAIVTGADAISGWTCEANILQIRFDGGGLITLPYGGTRGDTVGACGDDDNGFALAWNWALLGPGQHTLEILKDGVVDATRTVEVIDLGTEFLTGASGLFTLPDFPAPGQSVEVEWIEGKQNFSIVNFDSGGPPPLIMPGLYIGRDDQGSQCPLFFERDPGEDRCDVRLNIGNAPTGGMELQPSALVDFLRTRQCDPDSPGTGESIAFLMLAACDQDYIAFYRACSTIPISSAGTFQFVVNADSGVEVQGSCNGTRCTGIVTERTTLDPICSHPEIAWTADLAAP